ncbi:MAG: ExeM/NucH family extracellular endonuclease [Chloroflexota bacterium]
MKSKLLWMRVLVRIGLAVMVVLPAAAAGLPLGSLQIAQAALTELFISEYVEGSSDNKAIEIFNGTGAAINLGTGVYTVRFYHNGASTPNYTVSLAGTVASNNVFVLAHPSAVLGITPDQTSTSLQFNGDDAIVLLKNGVAVDSIGQVGVDPGTEWGSGLTSTADNTLRRKEAVCQGDPVYNDAFDPSVEWDGYAQNTFDGLGSHTVACSTPVLPPRINEFVFNHTGDDTNEFVEILGTPSTDYSAYTLLQIEGDASANPGRVVSAASLGTTAASGYWSTGYLSDVYQNGSSSLLLVEGFSGAVDDDLDTNDDGTLESTPWTLLVDDVAINDGGAGDRTYASTSLASGFDGVNYTPGGASRIPDGSDTDSASDWKRNDFDGEGLPGFSGTPEPPEAYNTSDAVNQAVPGQGAPFFSEYVEGSSYNKALEIYNGTGVDIDLAADAYTIQLYQNGSDTPDYNISLAGTLYNGNVFILAHPDAVLGITPDQTSGSLLFNGDDAVVLLKNGSVIDSIGQVGDDPGTEWGSGEASTADNTLRRKEAVCQGDPIADDSFDPSVEWDGYAQDTFDGLGSHTTTCGMDLPPSVASTMPANGELSVAVSANVVVNFSEAVTAGAGWYQIDCTLSGVHTATQSGGPSSFTLDPAADFTNGETCTVTVYAAQVSDQDGAPDSMSADYAWSFSVAVAGDPDACGAPFNPIYAIQGSGSASPYVGQVVSVEGVVVGDFQNTVSTKLYGFFIQDPSGDGDTSTSDGVFVYAPTAMDVQAGDLVRLKGSVVEFNTLTEIQSLTLLKVCSSGNGIAPAPVVLPETVNNDLERYEGMLVSFPETLTVAQNYFQGRYGQVTLGSEGRMYQSNNGNGLSDTWDLNARRLLVMDDGSSAQNPNPIPYIGQDNTLRAGDTLANLTGVIDYGLISSDGTTRDYRLHPTVAPNITRVNERTAAPEAVGGNLKVASFNVLNYFTTMNSRGADNATEFTRQKTKIFAALAAMNADIVGLIEIENNGATAISDLVTGLNALVGAGTYSYVIGPATGSDAIQVAFIYKPGVVQLVGPAQNYQVDLWDYTDLFNRPALAQTFRLTANNQIFTLVVNHFKSKGCDGATGIDMDQGDGQGCYNGRRVAQATALLDFIDQLKTSSGDDDVLVIGDLNAYGQEDPMLALLQGGLLDEAAAHVPAAERYSYIFDGQSGELDHALATGGLHRQVNDVTIWHINADEPSVIDYNTEFKSQDLYTPTPYRASDHDPVMIGLNLGSANAYVDDNDPTCSGNSPCYSSIQAAINTVSAGQAVYVYAGSYPENVNLNKAVTVHCLGDVTFQGLTQSDGVFVAPFGTLSASGEVNINAGIFNHNRGTLALTGAAAQALNGISSLRHLTVDNSLDGSPAAALSGDLFVGGTLTLSDGWLALGDYHLTLGSMASTSGGSADSMVITNGTGELRKALRESDPDPITLPLGDLSGTAEYSPAWLDFDLINGAGTVGAGVIDTFHPYNTSMPRLSRYWTITQSGLSSFTCDTTFYYTQADVELGSGQSENEIHGAHFNGSSWTVGAVVDEIANSFSLTVSSFSDFSGTPQSPTAIWVSDIAVTPGPAEVDLSWKSLAETGAQGYNVYRANSELGDRTLLNSELIEIIPGGLPGTLYGFIDESATPGVTYFYWIYVLLDDGSSVPYGPYQGTANFALYLPLSVQP